MAEKTTSRRTVIVSVVAVVAFVAIVVGIVVWAIGRPSASAHDQAALRTAFASAMLKASVNATYPAAAPIPLGSVTPTGEHPFSATFTDEELTALLSAFSYTATVNGSQVALKSATVRRAGPDTLGLDAGVELDGKDYSATLEGPLIYSFGTVSSTGATSGNVEGITLKAGQLAQVSNAVVDYLNAYLRHAPGLRIGSARITADGVEVTGAAPDGLTYP